MVLFFSKPGEYIFSFTDREPPVYGPDKSRIGNCKKINVCGVDKESIHSYKSPSKKEKRISKFIVDRLSNGLFLQLNMAEDCIALDPWHVIDNPTPGSRTYFIIPSKKYESVSEFEFLGRKTSVYVEAIVLNFPIKSMEDLFEYHSFAIRGDMDHKI